MLRLLVLVVVVALVFDYINGFHDAANAIATVVSTGVLPVRTAVIMAAVLNFTGAIAGTAVAKTIATGFADPAVVTQPVVLVALIGASIWNLLTWWFGLPSSSSHALIGGLAGAVVSHAGMQAFDFGALRKKVLLPLVVSPTAGFVTAFFFMIGLLWVVRGHLDARGESVFGVTGRDAPELAEFLEIVVRHVIPRQMQQRIKEHATMPARKDEAVTSHLLGVARIVA